MEEIGKILPAVFKKQVRRAQPPLVELLAPLWPQVVGKAIAQQSRPVAFGAGTLTLGAFCLSWAAQLRQMAEEIRAEINSFLGSPVVKKVRVQHVPQPGAVEAAAPQGERAPDLGLRTPNWPDGAAKLDPEISGILKRSFTKYFARRKGRVH